MSLRINPADFCSKDFVYSKNTCAQYQVNTDCSTIADAANLQTVCENCKNYTLTSQYVGLNKGTSQNFLNMKEEYQKSWYQTGNLGVGILFLMACIYYQK